ncbi:hypothetical protein BJ912DRAFT_645449 [Pholiota molesta]|nr:hypothetical protein BJ912DRAFT_645449 [Pholiota molesta]
MAAPLSEPNTTTITTLNLSATAHADSPVQTPPTSPPARSSNGPPPRFESPAASAALGGPSLQRVAKVYATTAEAIAHFKPTPREVISGIAPHVFDERKRRRSSSQHRAKPKPYWPYGQKRSSPLRGATIISWDEHSIYLEQPAGDAHDDLKDAVDEKAADVQRPTLSASAKEARDDDRSGEAKTQQQRATKKRAAKHAKSGWRYLRVDIQLLK